MGNFRIALVKAELGSGSWEGPGSGPLALSPLAPGPLHNIDGLSPHLQITTLGPRIGAVIVRGFFPPYSYLFIYLFVNLNCANLKL